MTAPTDKTLDEKAKKFATRLMGEMIGGEDAHYAVNPDLFEGFKSGYETAVGEVGLENENLKDDIEALEAKIKLLTEENRLLKIGALDQLQRLKAGK